MMITAWLAKALNLHNRSHHGSFKFRWWRGYWLAVLVCAYGYWHSAFAYNAISNRSTLDAMTAHQLDYFQIDGQLSEWTVEHGETIAISDDSRYKAHLYLGYTADGLYVSVRFLDDTPLNNPHQIEQAQDAWNGDAVQLRLSTNVNTILDASLQTSIRPLPQQNERISHLTFWYGARDKLAHHHLARGMEFTDSGVDIDGVIGAYELTDDGYQFEYFLPWSRLAISAPPRRGDFIQGQWQLHWGNASGNQLERGVTDLRPQNNYNDLSYHGPRSWGRIYFDTIAEEDQITEGGKGIEALSIPLEFAPTDYKKESVQILSEDGTVIRTYYAGNTQEKLLFDGYDDQGKPLARGQYRARRLLHNGIQPRWQCTLGDSGNPSWRTVDGRGGQVGNYGIPRHLISSSHGLLIGTGKSEATPSLVLLDDEGAFIWGSISISEQPMALQDDAIIFQWQPDSNSLARYDVLTGLRLDDLPLQAVPEPFDSTSVVAIGVAGETVAFATESALWLYTISLDSANSSRWHSLPITGVKGIYFEEEQRAFVATENNVIAVNTLTKSSKPIFSYANIAAMSAHFVEHEPQFALALTTHQIHIVDKDGNLLKVIGSTHPRAVTGEYNQHAMLKPNAVAFHDNSIWVAEGHAYPKRFSQWSLAGAFQSEYFAAVSYSAAAWWDVDHLDVLYGGWGRFIWDRAANSCRYDGGILDVEKIDPTITVPMHSAAEFFEYDGGRYAAIKQWSQISIFRVLEPEWQFIRFVEPRRKDYTLIAGVAQQPTQLSREDPFLYKIDKRGNLWAIKGFAYAYPHTVTPNQEPYYVGYAPPERWITSNNIAEVDFDWIGADKRGGSVSDIFIDTDGSFYTLVSNGDIPVGANVVAEGHRLTKFAANGNIDWVYEDVELAFAWNSSACIPPRICAAKSFVRGNSQNLLGITGYYGQYFLIDKKTGLYVTALGEDQRSDFSYGPHMIFTESFNGTLQDGENGEVYFLGGDIDLRLWQLEGVNDRKIEEITFTIDVDVPAKVLKPSGESNGDKIIEDSQWIQLSEDARFRVLVEGQNLYIELDVSDSSPFKNSASDDKFLFAYGDAIDIQFGAMDEAKECKGNDHRVARTGDHRILVTDQGIRAMRMSDEGYMYRSPTGEFGPVVIEDTPIKSKISRFNDGYYARVRIPLWYLESDKELYFDIGIIYSDVAGKFSARRTMWADQSPKIGINNDLPSQASFRLGEGVLNLPAFGP